MGLLNTIILLLAGCAVAAIAFGISWSVWAEAFSKSKREITTAMSRGRAVIKTPWGFWYVYAYRKYSETQVHFVLKDTNGMKHQLMVHAHELRPVNKIQAIAGPGNPMWEYVPGVHAATYAANLYAQDAGVAAMHAMKDEASRASTRGKLAEVKHDERVRETLEQHATLERSKTPPEKSRK